MANALRFPPPPPPCKWLASVRAVWEGGGRLHPESGKGNGNGHEVGLSWQSATLLQMGHLRIW